jgi:hypothetical protein
MLAGGPMMVNWVDLGISHLGIGHNHSLGETVAAKAFTLAISVIAPSQ